MRFDLRLIEASLDDRNLRIVRHQQLWHAAAQKQVLRLGERSRAVDAASAFAAIRTAHDELRDDLRRAAAVNL